MISRVFQLGHLIGAFVAKKKEKLEINKQGLSDFSFNSRTKWFEWN